MSETEKIKSKKSLGRRLLINMVSMAIFPLLMLSGIGYRYVSNEVETAAIENLKALALLQSKSISLYFEIMIKDLYAESDRYSNVEFLKLLESAFKESDKTIATFVKGYQWNSIIDKLGGDLEVFGKTYGYSDVKLVDSQGNILFTLKKSSDLGTNLFSEKLSTTRLSKSVKLSLKSEDAFFSDLEYFEADDEVYGFFTKALIDDEGNVSGVLVLEITDNTMNTLVSEQASTIQSQKEEIFLVGIDHVFRTSVARSTGKAPLSTRFESKEIDSWFNHHIKDNEIVDANQEDVTYREPEGRELLAVIQPIQIANVVWGVVAQVETQHVYSTTQTLLKIFLILTSLSILIILCIAIPIAQKIVKPILKLTGGVREASLGNLDIEVNIEDQTEIGELASGYNKMLSNIKRNRREISEREWYESGIRELNNLMRGAQDKSELAQSLLSQLVRYLQAQHGAFYWAEDSELRLRGSFGLDTSQNQRTRIKLGDGLIGQAAKEGKPLLVENVPENYVVIQSGIGESPPKSILIFPFVYNGDTIAVVELAWLDDVTSKAKLLLEKSSENIAVTLITLNQRDHVLEMLKESQSQSEELQAQQEELRVTNEALSEKSRDLRRQQENLKKAHKDSEEKAKAIEEASKYKSEFLANMSHELRTPLNSLLILARSLAENDEGHLSNDEVESAKIIQESGHNLLELINEILDLSKVEAGQMKLIAEDVRISDFMIVLNGRFKHMAEDKKIDFEIRCAKDVPEFVVTDGKKLGQILTNLISNAIKFTADGRVLLDVTVKHSEGILVDQNQVLSFSVIDTGIGIAEDKQEAVFEAFQQADGTTSRTHGGTGLGLSIALSFARLLGGDIKLKSVPGSGSTFSLFLPLEHKQVMLSEPSTFTSDDSPVTPVAINKINPTPPPFTDDRDRLDNSKKLVLVIEDDVKFLKILVDVCHKQNCQAVVATDGESGLALAEKYPVSGVILDYMLPGLDGGEILGQMRKTPSLENIPVHMISALDNLQNVNELELSGFATKPVSNQKLAQIIQSLNKENKRVEILAVENDQATLYALKKLFEKENVNIRGIDNGYQALEELKNTSYDAMILDLNLPDISGFELLEKTSQEKIELPTVFIYTGKDISDTELERLEPFTGNIITKSIRSPERLLDEVHLFANQLSSQTEGDSLVERNDEKIQLDVTDNDFEGRTILLVDDDMRNTFALAKVLRKNKLTVRLASSGQQCIDLLNEQNDIELILMDIMMPEMDGYETMRRIRKQAEYKELAMIAVTANAMPGDKEKCIQAGANDYLTKPVDIDQLLTMIKLWL
ncbi:hybrid sensor histidine kinase/response regulator [Aliikangiella coralliicola]|uniref:histidine kinase n=1 Tax=Aliikangiella coralliicola TaxID=2592383 RepID=A0A545U4K4_9GAMM|nr:response regulator [Aliikangiella coralliicola]TQV84374.1 response regulator [Aliikangiella coralliicola]